ncbi:6-pyruvoyltetrahydropterin/6-carboxytetrahydropterin synthase [Haloactinopolyspora alba]|uniref:6-carboxy-5,6,7,8-tetrahydropterin synthase n=1 Tax=Haloactinopolyspora alba TaxID=648780 RepID=A0A2P8DF17_9ACTN|nr:6-carboxytetrahydropterin synthase [Haloactinopolyspora alba]PSK95788.1 6-pyruvoyltetrahydropterin/6-carboxytetrahydropterin synthase [Haloactinopolyspora alba]
MTLHTVTVRHNFETAHRLPPLAGKCQNLHGHSWWADITVAGPIDEVGTVVEFGRLKAELRDWIDTHLDHGAMLGHDDPLVPLLRDMGSKVYVIGWDAYTRDLSWPTVESAALLLARVTTLILDSLDASADVTHVRVRETHVNEAGWSA